VASFFSIPSELEHCQITLRSSHNALQTQTLPAVTSDRPGAVSQVVIALWKSLDFTFVLAFALDLQ
jgi:hypothetical protein